MYLPLEYVKRYSVLTELYCSEEYINCEPYSGSVVKTKI